MSGLISFVIFSFFIASSNGATPLDQCGVKATLARAFNPLEDEAAQRIYAVDPNTYANFSKSSQKEFNRQKKLAESLVGKELKHLGFVQDEFSEFLGAKIIGVPSITREQFKKEGIKVTISKTTIDGGAWLSMTKEDVSLYKILTHAKVIEDWKPPRPLKEGPLPAYQIPGTIDPLTAKNGLSPRKSGLGTLTQFEQGAFPETKLLKSQPVLTELSNESRLALEDGGYRIKQTGILSFPADSDFKYILFMADKMGAEVRVVDATLLSTGKRIPNFISGGFDIHGKPLLLIPQQYLSIPKSKRSVMVNRLQNSAYGHIVEDIMKPRAKSWITQHYGRNRAFQEVDHFHYFRTMDHVMDDVRYLRQIQPSEGLAFSKETQNRFQVRNESVQSLGRLPKSDLIPWFNSIIESVEEKGGRVELVRWTDAHTGEAIPRNNGAFVRGKNGEPILLVTEDTVLMNLTMDWMEFLNTLE